MLRSEAPQGPPTCPVLYASLSELAAGSGIEKVENIAKEGAAEFEALGKRFDVISQLFRSPAGLEPEEIRRLKKEHAILLAINLKHEELKNEIKEYKIASILVAEDISFERLAAESLDNARLAGLALQRLVNEYRTLIEAPQEKIEGPDLGSIDSCLEPAARRQFKNLPPEVQAVVVSEILKAKANPTIGHKESNFLNHVRFLKFKVGKVEYRIAYVVVNKKKEILVEKVGTRENFYKRLDHLRPR